MSDGLTVNNWVDHGCWRS